MSENIILVQALAELAYSIALADGELDKEEKLAFNKIIETELGKYAWSAKNRFAMLEEKITPNVEQSYKIALFAIRNNKGDFTPQMRSTFINVIEKVAEATGGLADAEKAIIDRFKVDIKMI